MRCKTACILAVVLIAWLSMNVIAEEYQPDDTLLKINFAFRKDEEFGYKELLRICANREIVISENITLDEAKGCIFSLAKTVLRQQQDLLELSRQQGVK